MSDLFEDPIFEEWKDLEIANQEIREESEEFPIRIPTLGEELESLVRY